MNPLQTMVDEARIDQFYKEIEGMVVTLDEEFSHSQFNRKSVLLRNYMDRLATINAQLSGDHHRVSRQLLKLEKLHDLQRNALLASDMSVRSERTHAAQLAKVGYVLRAEIQEINLLSIQQADLESMMGLVKTKLQDLHNAQSSLRDQRKMFELIHANGRGLPAITESVTKMESELDTLLATMASPVSPLGPVEGFLDLSDAGEVSTDTSPSAATNLDDILNTIPSLNELRQKQKKP